MSFELIRRQDLDFLLYEVFDVEALAGSPPFEGQDRESFDAVIDAALRIAVEKLEPIAAELDEQEPRWENGQVTSPPSLAEATDAINESGFIAAGFPEELGGIGLPYTVVQAYMAIFNAANVSAAAYPLLTIAAANLLMAHGSEEQQARYLPPMLEGRYFGTMCLSETQAGSSLADVSTTATRREDGRYDLVGNKMWISGGEHELSENIVHMVLARVAGAPPGARGISLFIVPRYRVNEDGSLGEANDVRLQGLNHKMGFRGTVNTVLSFGDAGGCIGELIGEENRGLAYMFHMMNEARIGVGLGAAMLGYAGYRHAVHYAGERLQGRDPRNKNPENPQLPIIAHADVRRMLLAQKAYVEGAMALTMYCARLVDDIRAGIDEDNAALLLDVLTPIAKAWPSDYCLEANALAIQVLGGYGYTRDFPVERLYRDNRLNAIHEGTNGIQALDLLGRKVMLHQGAGFRELAARISETAAEASKVEKLTEFAAALDEALTLTAQTTKTLTDKAMEGEIDEFLANANDYLQLVGHVVVAWLWLRQALVAQARLAEQAGSADFYRGKLAACRYFFRRELPRTRHWAKLLRDFEDTPLTAQPEWF